MSTLVMLLPAIEIDPDSVDNQEDRNVQRAELSILSRNAVIKLDFMIVLELRQIYGDFLNVNVFGCDDKKVVVIELT